MKTKAVSLGAELQLLQRSVQGEADRLDVETIEPNVAVTRQVVATLNLIASRIRQLRRAVVGAEDPANLLAPHNEVGELGRGDDPDVLLHARAAVDPRQEPRRRRAT